MTTKTHTPAPYSTAGIIAERDRLKGINAELVAALEMCVNDCTAGEDCPLSPSVYNAVCDALDKAKAA